MVKTTNKGYVTQIIGPVLDIAFESNKEIEGFMGLKL